MLKGDSAALQEPKYNLGATSKPLISTFKMKN